MSSGTLRSEIERFDGTNDFVLWKVKMESLLTHQGLLSAVDTTEPWPAEMTEPQRARNTKKARASLFLNLSDSVLREVVSEKTPAAVWTKLDSLYMTKSVANRLYLKQKLFSFKMKDNTPLARHLDNFNKILMDLETVDAKVSDEDQSMILLCSLPRSYDSLVDTLLYGRESITMQDVKTSLNNSELRKRRDLEEGSSAGAGLVASRVRQGSGRRSHSGGSSSSGSRRRQLRDQSRSRSSRDSSQARSSRDSRESRDSRGKRSQSRSTGDRSQSRGGGDRDISRQRCWRCQQRGHFQRDCPERQPISSESEHSQSGSDDEDTAAVVVSAESEVLFVSGHEDQGLWYSDTKVPKRRRVTFAEGTVFERSTEVEARSGRPSTSTSSEVPVQSAAPESSVVRDIPLPVPSSDESPTSARPSVRHLVREYTRARDRDRERHPASDLVGLHRSE